MSVITPGRTYGCVKLCVLLLVGFSVEVASQSTAAAPTATSFPRKTCVTRCECSSSDVSETAATVTVDCSNRGFPEVPLNELFVLAQQNDITISHLDFSNNKITRIRKGDFKAVNRSLETVDLRGNMIRTIEDEAFKMHRIDFSLLHTIHLSQNRLESLPDDVFLDLKLHTLDLSFNILNSVPRALGRTQTIVSLKLNNNPLRELANNSFSGSNVRNGFKSVVTMDLSACQLTSFDTCDLGFSTIFLSISELYLDQNKFTTIKNSFFKCVISSFGQLLSIRRSEIRTIEEKSFSNFKQLNVLNLEGNNLGLFRSRVFKGLRIYELDLSNCNITEFKRTIFKDTRISQNLYMSGNNLGVVHHKDFTFLSGIHTLDFSNSSIRVIKGSPFENLTNLGVLSLANNQLEDNSIEKGLSGLRSVYTLDLSNNRLTTFPNLNGSRFPSLIEVFLANNRIHRLYRDHMRNMSRLGEIILKGNDIVFIEDDAFAETPNVSNLDLDGMSVSHLPNMSYLPKLLSLSARNGKLDYLPHDLCRTCTTLAVLEVEHNKLRTLPSFVGGCKLKILGALNNTIDTLANDTLSEQSLLHLLDLEGNHISSIPEGFFNATQYMEFLYLGYNQITSLSSDVFASMPFLIRVDLSFNKISRLENGLFHNQVKTLQWLNLAHNSIKRFEPHTLAANSSLFHLNLSANHLTSVHFPKGGLQSLLHLYLEDNFKLYEVPNAYETPSVTDVKYPYVYHCCIWDRYKKAHPYIDHDLENEDEDPTTIPTPTAFSPPSTECLNGEHSEKDREMLQSIAEQFNISIIMLPGCKIQLVTSEGADIRVSDDNAIPYISHRTGDRIPLVFTRAVMCSPRPDSLSPCDNLMDPWALRVFVWAIWVLALLGNGTVLFVAIAAREKLEVYQFLICCLAFADFCMGVYLAFLAAVDIRTFGEVSFYQSALYWQKGAGCQAAGFIAIFASELSIFILIVLTLERVHTIAYVLKQNEKVKMKFAIVAAIVSVVLAAGLAALPLFNINSYSQVGVCLPYLTKKWTDRFYIGLLLTISLVAFLIILFSYLYILKNICTSPASSQKRKEISIAAAKIALLIVTAFLCWIPIAVIGYLALAGIPTVDTAQAKFLIVFVYPLNACLNPFIYAIFTRQFREKVFAVFKRSNDRIDNSFHSRRIRLTRASNAFLPDHFLGPHRGSLLPMEMMKMRQSRRSNSLSVQLVTNNNTPHRVQTPPVIVPPPGAFMGRRASLPAAFGSTLRSLQSGCSADISQDAVLASNTSVITDPLPFRFSRSFHTGENSSQPDLSHETIEADHCQPMNSLDSPLTGSQESANRPLPGIPEEQEENVSLCSSDSDDYSDAQEEMEENKIDELSLDPEYGQYGLSSELSTGPSVSSLCPVSMENGTREDYNRQNGLSGPKYKMSSDSACSGCNSIVSDIDDKDEVSDSPVHTLTLIRGSDSFSSYDLAISDNELLSDPHRVPGSLHKCNNIVNEATTSQLDSNKLHNLNGGFAGQCVCNTMCSETARNGSSGEICLESTEDLTPANLASCDCDSVAYDIDSVSCDNDSVSCDNDQAMVQLSTSQSVSKPVTVLPPETSISRKHVERLYGSSRLTIVGTETAV